MNKFFFTLFLITTINNYIFGLDISYIGSKSKFYGYIYDGEIYVLYKINFAIINNSDYDTYFYGGADYYDNFVSSRYFQIIQYGKKSQYFYLSKIPSRKKICFSKTIKIPYSSLRKFSNKIPFQFIWMSEKDSCSNDFNSELAALEDRLIKEKSSLSSIEGIKKELSYFYKFHVILRYKKANLIDILSCSVDLRK